MMRIYPTVMTVALLCMSMSASWALELRTRAQEETEPKFIAKAGKLEGSCIDIFRALERMDPDLHIVGDQEMVPLKRLEAMLEGRQADIACGLVHSSERDQRFAFIEQPLFQVHNVLIARADESLQIKSWDDVRKLGAEGVVLGNAGRGPVEKLKKIPGLIIDDSAKATEQNLQKLMSGRARFFYHRVPGAMGEIRALKAEHKVKILPDAMSSDDYLMMLGKHVSAASASRLAEALAKLKASGELDVIAERWRNY